MSQDKKPKRKTTEQNDSSNIKTQKPHQDKNNLSLSKEEVKILSKAQQTNQDKKIFFSTKKEAKTKLDKLKVGDQVTITLSVMNRLETYPDVYNNSYMDYPVNAVITGMRFNIKEITTANEPSTVITKIISVKLSEEIKVPIIEKTIKAGVFEADTYRLFPKDQEIDLFIGEREWCLNCYKRKYCGNCKMNLPFKIPYIFANSNAKYDCRNNLYFQYDYEHFYFGLQL